MPTSDLLVVNLEYPISKNGFPEKGKVNLKQSTSFLRETFPNNPIVANLSNNHIMDYGEEAYYDTIEVLEGLEIPYFGAGNGLKEFNNPYVFEQQGQEYALFGFCCYSTNAVMGAEEQLGACPLMPGNVIHAISEAKSNNQKVVLNLHWGQEEIHYPKPDDITLARQFIDVGADLIIGHHAHVIQSHEIYNSKYIFYGLGNFIFPDLNVPSLFDGKKFTSRYVKPQYSWNRESLMVNLSDEKISICKAILKGDRIDISKHNENKYNLIYDQKEWINKLNQTRKKKKILRLAEKPWFNLKKIIDRF